MCELTKSTTVLPLGCLQGVFEAVRPGSSLKFEELQKWRNLESGGTTKLEKANARNVPPFQAQILLKNSSLGLTEVKETEDANSARYRDGTGNDSLGLKPSL